MIKGDERSYLAAVEPRPCDLEQPRTWVSWEAEWVVAWVAKDYAKLIGLLECMFELDIDNESTEDIFGRITPHKQEMIERVVFLCQIVNDLSGSQWGDADEQRLRYRRQHQLLIAARMTLATNVFQPDTEADAYWDAIREHDDCRGWLLRYFALEYREQRTHGSFRIPGIDFLSGKPREWAESFALSLAEYGMRAVDPAHQGDFVDLLLGLGQLGWLASGNNWKLLSSAGWQRLVELAVYPLRVPEDIGGRDIEEVLLEARVDDDFVAKLYRDCREKQAFAARC